MTHQPKVGDIWCWHGNLYVLILELYSDYGGLGSNWECLNLTTGEIKKYNFFRKEIGLNNGWRFLA